MNKSQGSVVAVRWIHGRRVVIRDQFKQPRPQLGRPFRDQNGIQVHDSGVYGRDEQGELYDIEPLVSFRPSEY